MKDVGFALKTERITVTTDGSGNAAKVSNNIFGEILKIEYDRGTVNAGTTAVTTNTFTGIQIDSKDVNAAAKAETYPVVARAGTAAGDNKWTRHVISGSLTVTVSSGAASKTFTVIILYR